MIELTREEALAILKELALLEGYIWTCEKSNSILETMDYSVELLTKKLSEEK